MRILIDESIPRPLKREFVGLDVTHVSEIGWQGRKNGYLLASMREQGFDTLLTVDKNLLEEPGLSDPVFAADDDGAGTALGCGVECAADGHEFVVPFR